VIDGKRLVGIVTVSDLLELLGRGIDRPAKPARRGLHHRAPHRKGKGDFGIW
jgi:CBS domain-containing protein